MPRFAILTHDYPKLHWDFLLEAGAACRTWRLPKQPGVGRAGWAEAIADHRSLYLTYEGPVSRDRGMVTRWDGGRIGWIRDEEDEIVVRLTGKRLTAECRLTRVRGNLWRIEFTVAG